MEARKDHGFQPRANPRNILEIDKQIGLLLGEAENYVQAPGTFPAIFFGGVCIFASPEYFTKILSNLTCS